MNQKRTLLLVGLIAVLLCLAVWLCFCPYQVKDIDVTLNAVKMGVHEESYSTELGVVQITIKGHLKKYLFQDSRLEVEIVPFDDLTDITSLTNIEGHEDVAYRNELGLYNAGFIGTRTDSTLDGNDRIWFHLWFNEDLDMWYIHRFKSFNVDDVKPAGYFATTNINYSTEDVIETFQFSFGNYLTLP